MILRGKRKRARLIYRWNAVYPLYFDAKVSIKHGRRVPRKESVWWPQATQIAKACRVLGLPSVLEVSSLHPSSSAAPSKETSALSTLLHILSRAPPDPFIRSWATELVVRTRTIPKLTQQPDRCHPADWENPGRVKIQISKDGRFLNPIVKNRTSADFRRDQLIV